MWKTPEIIHGEPTIYGWMVLYPEKLNLGWEVDIGAFSLIQAQFGVRIGHRVQIGAGVKIYSVSTIDGIVGKVTIQDNARIGANSVIMPGCFIGEGSIVGALSFLKAHTIIPNREIWCGLPAKRKGGDKVIKTCSKCNSKNTSVTYKKGDLFHKEKLEYRCLVCGYLWTEPTEDNKDIKPFCMD